MKKVAIVAGACLLVASTAADAQNSEETYQAIIDQLVALKEAVIERTPEGDGVLRAEGFRQILRMVSQGTEAFLDDHDTAHPKIGRCPSLNCKLGQDNPDNTYLLISPLDDAHVYRVFGRRNDTLTLFQLRTTAGLNAGTLNTEEMVFAEDGSYQIILSPTEQPGNWMQTGPDTAQLLVRAHFDDWDNDIETTLEVEVLDDAVGEPVESLSPEVFASKASDLTAWLGFFELFASRPDTFPVNGMDSPRLPGPFGNPDIINARGRWALASDEALLIERPVTRAVYINVQISHLWWASLDYASRQTSLSGHQTYIDSDGVIRYVIARSDPGVPNWLDARDHPEGTIHMRWVLPNSEDPPRAPDARVVPLTELRDVLPADHPAVSAEERREIIRRRVAAYSRRLNPPGAPRSPSCPGDFDGNGDVTIDELVRAVDAALTGCTP